MRSEAHLPAALRHRPVVQIVDRGRRSWRGWLILATLVALNEARGLAVVGAVLRALHWSTHP